jgi:hypothetical protein
MDTLQDHPDTRRSTTHQSAYPDKIRHLHELLVDGKGRYTARTDGPASILVAPNGVVREEWAAHPDPSSIWDYQRYRPILVQGIANPTYTYLHRQDGPALIERMNGPDSPPVEVWYRDNKQYAPTAHERMKWEARKAAHGGTPFHNDTIEAMAGKYPRMGGDCQTWEAFRTIDGGEQMVPHRPKAPAFVGYDRKTGAVIHEEWFLDGQNTNPNGPYRKRYDPRNGVCVCEYGNLLPGKPYQISRDRSTGKVVFEEWPDRKNGPRTVEQDPDTGRIRENWPNKRSRFLPGKPTIKAAAAWEALKAQQGGPFTPGLDEVPAAQRPASVKEAAAAAAAKTESKRKPQHQDER